MFSGVVSYTVNPGKQPIDYEDAKFKNVGPRSSELVVTSRERSEARAQTGGYYICIFPHMTSTYSLIIKEVPSSLDFEYIEDAYDKTGEIRGNEMKVFMYKVPPLDYENEDISVEFMLTTISGPTPLMAAKFCSE